MLIELTIQPDRCRPVLARTIFRVCCSKGVRRCIRPHGKKTRRYVQLYVAGNPGNSGAALLEDNLCADGALRQRVRTLGQTC